MFKINRDECEKSGYITFKFDPDFNSISEELKKCGVEVGVGDLEFAWNGPLSFSISEYIGYYWLQKGDIETGEIYQVYVPPVSIEFVGKIDIYRYLKVFFNKKRHEIETPKQELSEALFESIPYIKEGALIATVEKILLFDLAISHIREDALNIEIPY